MFNYSMKCGAACALAIMIQGCAASPRMSPDAPLGFRPGNWVGLAQFCQHGHRVDRGEAKDNLKMVDESAGDTYTAEALETGALVTSAVAGGLIGAGLGEALNHQKAWPFFLAGGATLGLSIAFGFSADGKYAGAVNSYNRQLAHRRPRSEPSHQSDRNSVPEVTP